MAHIEKLAADCMRDVEDEEEEEEDGLEDDTDLLVRLPSWCPGPDQTCRGGWGLSLCVL